MGGGRRSDFDARPSWGEQEIVSPLSRRRENRLLRKLLDGGFIFHLSLRKKISRNGTFGP